MAIESDESGRGRREASASTEQLRLMAKIARMHHDHGMRQVEIAEELHISQPRVSRLLKRAAEIGIVRTIVSLPAGVHTEVEEALEARYGLAQAVVVESAGSDDMLLPALGSATAGLLETTMIGGDTVGISAWSASLLAAVESLPAARGQVADRVVQLIGGIGEPSVQVQATRLLTRFANLTGATPLFMPAPGLLSSPEAIESLLADSSLVEVVQAWRDLSLALVGIGSLEPSPLLRESGNAVAERDQVELRKLGAVGDICLRFFDADGRLVDSELNRRIVGIDPELIRAVPRRVGVAGGARKYSAIRAALRGGWVNILVTDLATAQRLVAEA